MNRRGFLQTCLALCAAPAIVRADSLMRIVPRDTLVLTPLGDSIRARLLAGHGWQDGDLITLSGLRGFADATYRVMAVNGNVLTLSA